MQLGEERSILSSIACLGFPKSDSDCWSSIDSWNCQDYYMCKLRCWWLKLSQSSSFTLFMHLLVLLAHSLYFDRRSKIVFHIMVVAWTLSTLVRPHKMFSAARTWIQPRKSLLSHDFECVRLVFPEISCCFFLTCVLRLEACLDHSLDIDDSSIFDVIIGAVPSGGIPC